MSAPGKDTVIREVMTSIKNELTQALTPLSGGAEMLLLATVDAEACEHASAIIGTAKTLHQDIMNFDVQALTADLNGPEYSGEGAALYLAQAMGTACAARMEALLPALAEHVAAIAGLGAAEPSLQTSSKIMQSGLKVLQNLVLHLNHISQYVLKADMGTEGKVTTMFDVWKASDSPKD